MTRLLFGDSNPSHFRAFPIFRPTVGAAAATRRQRPRRTSRRRHRRLVRRLRRRKLNNVVLDVLGDVGVNVVHGDRDDDVDDAHAGNNFERLFATARSSQQTMKKNNKWIFSKNINFAKKTF